MTRLLHWRSGTTPESGLHFRKVRTRTAFPEKLAGRGLSLRDDGRTRAITRQMPRGQAVIPASAQAVSTAAQSRSCSV